MVLAALQITPDVLTPGPNADTCDGILPLAGMDGDTWLIITNARGNITVHALQECSKAEAFNYLEEIRGQPLFCNPRLSFLGERQQNATPLN
jgi:hypothetical protein